ncbi:uncharacterized protein LOC129218684 [Uloborus diversus]|uniref:uncharacterized protein LOC129218684 n=1 Tax=Uloborus diversus TaxID=327109 RepID=UPI00240A5E7E|nr:uncharacterized protein LOC129218684 [Uloborus diversus]
MKAAMTTKILLLMLFALHAQVSKANSKESTDSYMDEVASVYIPSAVEGSGLELYEMPDFSHNFQNRSDDGTMIRHKISYHSGNLTGLEKVKRKSCEQPFYSSANITFSCILTLPEILVSYEGRVMKITSTSTSARFQEFPFGVSARFIDVEFEMTVTTSPNSKISSVKHLKIQNQGTPFLSFSSTAENMSYEILSKHFFHKYQEIFQELFENDYRDALETAVSSASYPVERVY